MTIAVVLDYDKTLSPHHMQEDTLFRSWGIMPEEFWKETTELVRERGYDRELAWMWHLLDFDAFRALKSEDLHALGPKLIFYPGVPDFFSAYPDVEFYIITAGLLEILKGSSLFQHVRKIFGCEYDVNEEGLLWRPKRTIGHTTKTQMLFRINKGLLEMDQDVNRVMPDSERPVPFEKMIYIGDGPTDIPCFTIVTRYGGKAIAVYNPEEESAREQSETLFRDGRVDRVCTADYREGSELRKTLDQFLGDIRGN
jgi:hypothetical protein